MTALAVPEHIPRFSQARWCWFGAAAALLVTVLAITPSPVGLWVDDGHYVILAKALASGHGLHYINLPGAPPGVHFPPGYPLVLSTLWMIAPEFPRNIAVFQFANALFAAAAAFSLVRLGIIVLGLPVRLSLATAVLWSLAVPTLMLANAVMSEALWWMVLLPAIIASEQAVRLGGSRHATVAGALLGASVLVRTVGIAPLAASIAVLAMRRRWREVAHLGLVALAIIAPWLLWKSANTVELPPVVQGMYGDYAGWMREGYTAGGAALLLQTVQANAIGAMRALGAYWSSRPSVAGIGIAAMLLMLTAVGAWHGRRRAPVLVLTLVVYVFMVMIWPFEPDRFLHGAAVIWMPLAAAGACALWQRMARHSRTAAMFASLPAAGTALAIVIGTIAAVPARAWAAVPGRDPGNVRPIAEWALQHTSPDALLATDAETFMYLYTGRLAVPALSFTALQQAGKSTSADRAAALDEVLSHYGPDRVLAITAPSLRAAESLTAGSAPRLSRVAVLRVGAVYVVNARTSPGAAVRP